MSEIGLGLGDPEHPDEQGHPDEQRRPRRRGRGCIPVLLILAVVAAGLWFGGSYAYDQISARFGAAPDYPGPGSGQVLFEVKEGASSTQIARDLKTAGVVKSVDAFTEAARSNSKSRNIQVGYYQLKKQMKASDAVALLVDPANLMQSLVVVPEGARVRQIVKTIVDKTDIPRKDVTAALANGKAIGLPPEAKGNPEGYLFPATYTVPPKQTALGLIRQMVSKAVEEEKSLDIATKAQALGYTPEQILTVASIIEYEANVSADYPKVARVLYNRLAKGMALQLDSTVAYVSQRQGDVWTTNAERANTSAYNTYVHTGLPPGPIGSPGETTIKAALNPSSGSQLFWVVVNLKTGETRYATTYAEHLKNVALFHQYCQTSSAC